MPIYEYQCSGCGHRLEALQKISDPALKECPACGEPKLAKLVSAASFRLKGGGWYETDFKKDNRKRLASTDDAGDGKAKTDDKKPAGDGSSAAGKDANKTTPESKADKPAGKPAN